MACAIDQLALTDSIEETKDIIEWTIKRLIESYKSGTSTRDILVNLVGMCVFTLYNHTYPNGITRHLNKDDVPLLYTILLFPREACFVGLHKIILIIIQ